MRATNCGDIRGQAGLCFASLPAGKCKCLRWTFPRDEFCPFFKTKEQAKEDAINAALLTQQHRKRKDK